MAAKTTGENHSLFISPVKTKLSDICLMNHGSEITHCPLTQNPPEEGGASFSPHFTEMGFEIGKSDLPQATQHVKQSQKSTHPGPLTLSCRPAQTRSASINPSWARPQA